MTELVTLLPQLSEAMRRFGVPRPATWQPGIDADTVRTQLAAHGLDAPQEIIDWFAWCDGDIHVTGNAIDGLPGYIVPINYAPMSLHVALEVTRPALMEDMAEYFSDFEPHVEKAYQNAYWKPSIVPLGYNQNGLLVADSNSPDGVHAPLGVHSRLDEYIPGTGSIATAVRHWITCIEAGVPRWRDDGRWWYCPPYFDDPAWPAWTEPGLRAFF